MNLYRCRGRLEAAPTTVCVSLIYLLPIIHCKLSPVIAVIFERPQEMAEGPPRHAPSLLPPLGVGEAEMNAFEDTGCDHILGGIRETAIVARLLDRHRVGGRHCEIHFVRPKKERKRAGRRARDVVGARSVVGIVRSVDQRLPVLIYLCPRVVVGVTESNGGYRPPKIVGDLGVPRGDLSIGCRQTDQREEPRTVSNVAYVSLGKFPNNLVPKHHVVGGPKYGEVSLIGSSGAVEARPHRFNLVVVPGVLMAGQSWWRLGAPLVSAFQGKRSDVRQPRRQHWQEGQRDRRIPDERRGRAPFTRFVATSEIRRVRWEAPVISPQIYDTAGGGLSDRHARVIRRKTVIR